MSSNVRSHSLSQSGTSESQLFAADSELHNKTKNQLHREIIRKSKIKIGSPLAIEDDNACLSPTPSVISPDIDHSSFLDEKEAISIDISVTYYDDDDDDDECDDDDEFDDIPFTQFLLKISEIDEQTIFAEHGYKRLNKICDTLQGALYRGQQISNNEYVAIKKTDKIQFKQRVTVENGFSFFITENRVKEALILQYLTLDNSPIGDYIIKYIDFFESDTDYYLIMEYVETEMNLKQFVQTAHEHIIDEKLKLKEYQKMIKYLYWQLAVTVHWLHDDMKCCHMDLCLDNILLNDCDFIKGPDGNLKINPAISIKLGDFGVAEMFKTDQSSWSLKTYKPFCCQKQHLSIDNEPYLAPEICRDEIYDSRSADIWSLGMILYECMTGEALYEPMEVWQSSISSNNGNGGYWALTQGKLKEYLLKTNKLRYFTTDSFGLLSNLLNVNKNKRYFGQNILSNKWFNLYYKKYRKQIHKKTICQNQKFIENKVKTKYFPFYKKIKK